MKLHVALASGIDPAVYRKQLSEGVRVVCKIAKNEWYTGTVTRRTKRFVHIDFDDGSDAKVENEDLKDVHVMTVNKQFPRALKAAEAKELFANRVPDTKVKREVKTRVEKISVDLSQVKSIVPEYHSQPKGKPDLKGSLGKLVRYTAPDGTRYEFKFSRIDAEGDPVVLVRKESKEYLFTIRLGKLKPYQVAYSLTDGKGKKLSLSDEAKLGASFMYLFSQSGARAKFGMSKRSPNAPMKNIPT